MHGFLLNIIQRQLRRLTLGAAVSMAILSATDLGTTGFHQPRFNQADLAVEQAQFLLGPSLCVASTEQKAAFCENLVRRAEELLARARQAVREAATVADGGDVALPRR
jgi:hypothetical protein